MSPGGYANAGVCCFATTSHRGPRRAEVPISGVSLLRAVLRRSTQYRLNRACAARAGRSVGGGRRWGKLSEKFGVLGFVRALEVTYGEEFGFHPHIHGVGARRPGRRRWCGCLVNTCTRFGRKGLPARDTPRCVTAGAPRYPGLYSGHRRKAGGVLRKSSWPSRPRMATLSKVAGTAGHRFKSWPTSGRRGHGGSGCLAGVRRGLPRPAATHLVKACGEMAGLAAKKATDDELAAEEACGEDRLQLPAERGRRFGAPRPIPSCSTSVRLRARTVLNVGYGCEVWHTG